jgi:hypothetical protein
MKKVFIVVFLMPILCKAQFPSAGVMNGGWRQIVHGDTLFIKKYVTGDSIQLNHLPRLWGQLSGSISSQTDLQNALNAKVGTSTTDTMRTNIYPLIAGKQASGNYASGITNTGDNAVNTTYSNDYRAANFIAGTNYLAPNGNGSLLTNLPTPTTISGSITESQVTNLVSDLAGKQASGSYAVTNTTDSMRANIYPLIAGKQAAGTYATASNSIAFTNKTGNISQWTNDASYLTSSSITGKVNYTDTASMLLAYQTAINSKAASSSLALKVNYTDTAAMLNAYNTATVARVKYTDTSNMLSAYQTAINAKLSPSGNAATATTLQTARTINGTSFNGSANITVPSDIAASTSGNVMQSNGSVWTSTTNTGGWTVLKVAGSDVTTTGQALVDITGLVTPTLTVSTLYEFEAVLFISSSAVLTGCQYGINCTGTGATGYALYTGTLAAGTASTSGTTALNTAETVAFDVVSSGIGVITIKGVFTSGTGSPVFSLKHLKTTSGTSTVKIGSVLRYKIM